MIPRSGWYRCDIEQFIRYSILNIIFRSLYFIAIWRLILKIPLFQSILSFFGYVDWILILKPNDSGQWISAKQTYFFAYNAHVYSLLIFIKNCHKHTTKKLQTIVYSYNVIIITINLSHRNFYLGISIINKADYY